MRKVALGMSVTLDGLVAGPGGELDWMFPTYDSEMLRLMIDSLEQTDVMLIGRRTYEDMAHVISEAGTALTRPSRQIVALDADAQGC
jgi:hypothetical protein